MDIIEKKLNDLSKSTFRNSFHLKDKDFKYIDRVGIVTIKEHDIDFVSNRLKYNNPRDGKQTPMRGHPIFVGQHATATCCRGCLAKHHGISNDHDLTEREINYIVNVLLYWIKNKYKSNK